VRPSGSSRQSLPHVPGFEIAVDDSLGVEEVEPPNAAAAGGRAPEARLGYIRHWVNHIGGRPVFTTTSFPPILARQLPRGRPRVSGVYPGVYPGVDFRGSRECLPPLYPGAYPGAYPHPFPGRRNTDPGKKFFPAVRDPGFTPGCAPGHTPDSGVCPGAHPGAYPGTPSIKP